MNSPANSNCWSSLAMPGEKLHSLLDTCSEEGSFAVYPWWRKDTELWGEVLFGLANFKHTQLEGVWVCALACPFTHVHASAYSE